MSTSKRTDATNHGAQFYTIDDCPRSYTRSTQTQTTHIPTHRGVDRFNAHLRKTLQALYGDGSGGDETDKCTEFVSRVFEPLKTIMETQAPPYTEPDSQDVLDFIQDTLSFYKTRTIARDVAAQMASHAPTPPTPTTPNSTPRARKQNRTATSRGPQPTASSASVGHKIRPTPSATVASAGVASGA